MLKITVIEDDSDFRNILCDLINKNPFYQCISNYGDCESAIQHIAEDKPDVIMLDISLPKMSGTDGVAVLKRIVPETEIIMLTIHTEERYVFQSLRNGASGYMLKNSDPEEYIKAIEEVQAGGAPMSMSIARMVAESFHHKHSSEHLTKRETEVLSKLQEGKSYQAIANDLYVSRSTVKFHIKNIYKKLHVANKYEALLKR